MPTTPDKDALQQALIAVVSDAVPQPPERIQRLGLDPDGRWDTFAKVFWAVHDAKDASRTSTAKQAAAGAHSEDRARKTRDLTATASVSAAELDPKALNLGSWMFGGEIPPYVARTADVQLAERLTAIATGLTVVVGPPKSGKSRSVLETLAGTVPDATVQWVNPVPGVLPALVDLHRKEKNAGPGVVVLDDAQFLGVNPMDGLTTQRLTELASRNRLIVIVHEHDLGMWRNQINNRTVTADTDMSRIGATPELIQLLDEHRIDYHAILDASELVTATALLDKVTSSVRGLDFTRLAEALASVDHFKSEATEELGAGGMRAALIEAAIDATILYPTGADIEQLEQLCKLHYRRFRPNLPWRARQFDDAFDWATTGYKESPHAILTRTLGSDQHYRLFDALTPALRTADRVLHHLEDLDLDSTSSFFVGIWAHGTGDTDTARSWWEKAADHDHPEAMFNLGFSYDEAGDVASARVWWEKAATRHLPRALFALGLIDKKAGDLVSACVWWEKAAARGHAEAMFKLGFSFFNVGDVATARSWWEKAAARDHADAMFNLGATYDNEGDLATARSWWEKAAARDHADAMFNLGATYYDEDDLATARSWWEKAAARDHPRAMFTLGATYYDEGDLATARSWLEKAAARDHPRAMFNLGILYDNEGDVATARSWWEKAAARDHPRAMFSLGILYDNEGDVATARSWWEKAAVHDHADAMSNLGATYYDEGDLATARSWWEKAAARDHADAMFNLGILYDNEGDVATARSWWEKAAARDHPRAMFSLGILYDNEGDVATARSWWEKAAVHDHPRAMFKLGVSFFNGGVVATARSWWEKAAVHDHPRAMFNLGVTYYNAGDLATARSWWEKAVAAGSDNARRALDELGDD
uniref:tetratricopeptide repeat protein n=1 Tax=Rhodococcus qingshengii TaxID=334542 RepID=UPI001C4DE427|nr:tetratricopeptide repeat protein [Rhodococcus qingshengii]